MERLKVSIKTILIVGLLLPALAQAKSLMLKSGAVDIKKAKVTLNQTMALGSDSVPQHTYFVIQFKNKINAQNHEKLRAIGLTPLKYIPEDAILVHSTLANMDDIQKLLPEVYDVIPYLGQWKLSQEYTTLSVFDSEKIETFQIKLLKTASADNVVKKLKNMNAEILSRSNNIIVANNFKSQAAMIAEIQGVEWVQKLPEIEMLDFKVNSYASFNDLTLTTPPAISGYESGTLIMKFDDAWDRGFTGADQTVAMMDTGLDTGSDLTLHKDVGNFHRGYIYGIGADSWEDPQGHGTHVTGSVVGNGTYSNGDIRGGAYDANFIAQATWSPFFKNISIPPDLKGAFKEAYDDGARIHTNSWGSPQNLGAYSGMSAQVDEFMWENPDMLLIFAAGNSGQDANGDGRVDEGSVSSPGTAKNALTVGASENLLHEGGIQRPLGDLRNGAQKWGVSPLKEDKLSNNPNGIAGFSSRGPTNDLRVKPEIVAPGTNIVSLRSRHPEASVLWGEYDENYVYAGGTSMATPLTAGAAAVVRGYLADALNIKNPSAALVKGALVHTAYDLYPGQYGTGPKQELLDIRPNVHEGYGRVDVAEATSLFDNFIKDHKEGVGTGEVYEKEFNIRDLTRSASFRVTMIYTDYPASTTAAKTLVNDLDLIVIEPDGTERSLEDHVNNTEMIEFTGLQEGIYKVKVKGHNVPFGNNGKQPFALLVALSR